MYAHVAQVVTPTLLFVLLPCIASLPHPIYGIKSYRRSVPVNNLNSPTQYYDAGPQQYDEQPIHYRQQPFESDPGANYYLDDVSGSNNRGHRLPQSFGLPTYRGEYKPTQYYYAHSPRYNYFDDRSGGNNPLDDLHEEMLQEDERERQSNLPVGQEQWFQNAGHPRSLTNTFLNNLILYNNKLNAEREREIEAANEYDEDDAYYGDLPSPSAYDVYEPPPMPHAVKTHPMPSMEQTQYFRERTPNVDRDEYTDYDKPFDQYSAPKEDEDVRELKSLSKSTHKNNNDDDYVYKAAGQPHRFSETVGYNGFDSPAEDYDDDAWINWDRKRSEAAPKQGDEMKLNQMKTLKALQHQLRMTLKAKELTETTTTTARLDTTIPTVTPTLDDVLGLLKLKDVRQREGQKEVVLSRPATPVRRIFSDPALDALSQGSSKQHPKQVNQSNVSHF